MCGIFGYSLPNLSEFQRGIIAVELARGNDKRGGHSWGYAGITDDDSVEIERGLGLFHPSVVGVAPYKMFMGHTRYATQGEKTVKNAHPFEIGRIIGAHNGVIYNHNVLRGKYKRDNFEVDSMHLVAHLDEGVDFTDIEGYGAMEWIDTMHRERVYLSRMRSGSLSIYGIGTPENRQGVVWSSDETHLVEALLAAGINTTFRYEVKEGGVTFVQRDGNMYCSAKRCDLSASSSSGAATSHWEDMRGEGYDPRKDDWRNYSTHGGPLPQTHKGKGKGTSYKKESTTKESDTKQLTVLTPDTAETTAVTTPTSTSVDKPTAS